MRNYRIPAPDSDEMQPEANAIRSYETFHQWKACLIQWSIPEGDRTPEYLTRRLEFHDHLPVSTGVYCLHGRRTLRKVDEIQDMLIELGFALREMQRRLAKEESVDDGKYEYLEGHYRAWVAYLTEIWTCMMTPGMRELTRWVVDRAAQWVAVTEEVRMFVTDLDEQGIEFLSERWCEEARVWTLALWNLAEGDWLCEGQDWREWFCEMVQGRYTP